MDVSEHFHCEVYSAHFWEHGRQVLVERVVDVHPLATLPKDKVGEPIYSGSQTVTTFHWHDHVCMQYANTSTGRQQMKIATYNVNKIPDLFGKKYVCPIEPVSWLVDGDVFILDMYMSSSHDEPRTIPQKKHVRIYLDRGLGTKIFGWENYDDTITKVTIDKGGNVCLTWLEDKKRKRFSWEEDYDVLGDDSDFSEDEDGYAIPKRNRKVVDNYRVKKTIILTPQEFATAIYNEHSDLMFFWLEIRKKLNRKRRIGFLTLCKMLLFVRRLRFQAIGRKWAPGGHEFEKHMRCDTAQVMSVPYKDLSLECM